MGFTTGAKNRFSKCQKNRSHRPNRFDARGSPRSIRPNFFNHEASWAVTCVVERSKRDAKATSKNRPRLTMHRGLWCAQCRQVGFHCRLKHGENGGQSLPLHHQANTRRPFRSSPASVPDGGHPRPSRPTDGAAQPHRDASHCGTGKHWFVGAVSRR